MANKVRRSVFFGLDEFKRPDKYSEIIKIQYRTNIKNKREQIQKELDEYFYDINKIDFSNQDHCQKVIYVIEKEQKNSRDYSFIKKVVSNFKVFQDIIQFIDPSILVNEISIDYHKKNHVLFRKGQYGQTFYLVLKGGCHLLVPQKQEQYIQEQNEIVAPKKSIKAQNAEADMKLSIQEFQEKYFENDQIVFEFQPGTAFGEIALMAANRTRTGTIICSSEVNILLGMTKNGFDKILKNYKDQQAESALSFLKTFSFIKNIPYSYQLTLLHNISTKNYIRSQFIYKEGDLVQYIFFIKSGRYKITCSDDYGKEKESDSNLLQQQQNQQDNEKNDNNLKLQQEKLKKQQQNENKKKNAIGTLKDYVDEDEDQEAEKKKQQEKQKLSKKKRKQQKLLEQQKQEELEKQQKLQQKQQNNQENQKKGLFIHKQNQKNQEFEIKSNRFDLFLIADDGYFGDLEIVLKKKNRVTRVEVLSPHAEVLMIPKNRFLNIIDMGYTLKEFLKLAKSKSAFVDERINSLIHQKEELKNEYSQENNMISQMVEATNQSELNQIEQRMEKMRQYKHEQKMEQKNARKAQENQNQNQTMAKNNSYNYKKDKKKKMQSIHQNSSVFSDDDLDEEKAGVDLLDILAKTKNLDKQREINKLKINKQAKERIQSLLEASVGTGVQPSKLYEQQKNLSLNQDSFRYSQMKSQSLLDISQKGDDTNQNKSSYKENNKNNFNLQYNASENSNRHRQQSNKYFTSNFSTMNNSLDRKQQPVKENNQNNQNNQNQNQKNFENGNSNKSFLPKINKINSYAHINSHFSSQKQSLQFEQDILSKKQNNYQDEVQNMRNSKNEKVLKTEIGEDEKLQQKKNNENKNQNNGEKENENEKVGQINSKDMVTNRSKTVKLNQVYSRQGSFKQENQQSGQQEYNEYYNQNTGEVLLNSSYQKMQNSQFQSPKSNPFNNKSKRFYKAQNLTKKQNSQPSLFNDYCIQDVDQERKLPIIQNNQMDLKNLQNNFKNKSEVQFVKQNKQNYQNILQNSNIILDKKQYILQQQIQQKNQSYNGSIQKMDNSSVNDNNSYIQVADRNKNLNFNLNVKQDNQLYNSQKNLKLKEQQQKQQQQLNFQGSEGMNKLQRNQTEKKFDKSKHYQFVHNVDTHVANKHLGVKKTYLEFFKIMNDDDFQSLPMDLEFEKQSNFVYHSKIKMGKDNFIQRGKNRVLLRDKSGNILKFDVKSLNDYSKQK